MSNLIFTSETEVSFLELMQLKYFKTVAKTEKISAAAQELFLSAPALSTSIARLEKEVGAPLFTRSGNRITLNEQGEIFLRYVNEVFDSLERAKTELHHSLLRTQNNIWVATTGSNLWLDMLTTFSQEYPQFTLTTTTTDYASIDTFFSQYTFLLAEEEDLPESCLHTLDCVQLFEDQPAVIVHPEHPLAQLDVVTPAMLRNENLFLPTHGMPRRERLIRLLQVNDIDPASANSCTYLLYRSMVQQNLGVAFTTMRSRHVNQGKLKVVPLENNLSPWVMNLYWRREHRMTPAEQSFRDFVIQFYRA